MSIAREYLAALETAVDVIAEFTKRHHREPTGVERGCAATIFIESMKKGVPIASPNSSEPEPDQQPTDTGPIQAPVPRCPKCGGEMWDNRADKKTEKSPDFKCKEDNGPCLTKGRTTAVWA